MVQLVAVTLFISATLLFAIQPMMGKLILPLLGGAPAVWQTCVMVFQFLLLAGYLWAHVTSEYLTQRGQMAAHFLVLAASLLFLPLGTLETHAGASAAPIRTVATLLVGAVGLPLLAVSSTAPLLQRWLTTTRDPAARDPFFLYSASNLGSLLALLTYPLLIEPMLTLEAQRTAWTAGYLLLVALTAVCAVQTRRLSRAESGTTMARGGSDGTAPDEPGQLTVTGWLRARWLMLSFAPSALSLSVTTYVTTDVAAVPLLWVAPLALYLLSFVLAFARRPLVPARWLDYVLPFFVVLAALFLFAINASLVVSVLIHFVVLFVVALYCHSLLAAARPSARHLTAFYLWISLGGLLGGVFVTLVAPLVFTRTLEYPLTLVVVLFLRGFARTSERGGRWSRAGDIAWPLLLAGLAYSVRDGFRMTVVYWTITAGPTAVILPLAASLSLARRPLRFGLAVGAIALVAVFARDDDGVVLHEERNFFGTLRVIDWESHRMLRHGTTNHGMQLKDPARQCEPTSYYTRTSPIGQLFGSFVGEFQKFSVAVFGLGTAGLTVYSQPYQRWTLFEIDPAVQRIASDDRYFTYLRDCAARPRIVLGDGRLEVQREPDASFDVMVFDAFSSDAIPVHLMTREALALYVRKLSPKGILAFQITNRHLELGPVLGALAQDAGLAALLQYDVQITPMERAQGKLASRWVVMARALEDFGDLPRDPRWTAAPASRSAVWTDSYSNLVLALRGRESAATAGQAP